MSSTVQGYVRRAHDKRVFANVRVKITYLGDGGCVQCTRTVQTAVTDRDGWFAFRDIDAGSYVVSADGASAQEITVDDFTSVSAELLVSSGATEPAVERSLEPAFDANSELPRATDASVQGRVISARTGYAIENASVMLLSGPGSAPDIAPLTNAKGEFSFHALAEGAWTVRAIAPDGTSKQVRFEVRPSVTAIVTIAIGSDGNNCRCTG